MRVSSVRWLCCSRVCGFAFLVCSLMLEGPSAFGQAASNFCEWTSLWKSTGSMTTPRSNFTATVLNDGRVLVTGGLGNTYSNATAEIYDPGTGRFTPTGSMRTARHDHIAVLLPNGRVLVAGGFSYQPTGMPYRLKSAEEYDPGTGIFTSVGNMTGDRQNAAATLLRNGTVLITGGYGSGQYGYSTALTTAEVYDPTMRSFSATVTSMATGRFAHTATLFPDTTGRVLIAGGYTTSGVPSDQAEIYDANFGTFSAAANAMANGRYLHTATVTPGGSIRLIGGIGPSSGSSSLQVLSTVEDFDPVSKSFIRQTITLATGRAEHAAVLTRLGTILVIGGTKSVPPLSPTTSVEKMFGSTASGGALSIGRTGPQAVLLNDNDILVVGGVDASGVRQTSAELYDPLFNFGGAEVVTRIDHTATLLNSGSVLVTGGGSPGGTNSAEIFDPATNVFNSINNMSAVRYKHRATLLSDGRVLITGGMTTYPTPINSAELFDPVTKTFTALSPMNVARSAHSSTLLQDSRVLLAGGALSTPGKTAEIFDPTAGTFTLTGSMTFDRSEHTANLLSGGTVLIAGGFSVADGNAPTFTTEIFDPATGQFTSQPQPNRLLVNRDQHTATALPSGEILMAGGITTGRTETNKAETYNPGLNKFAMTQNNMSIDRSHHAAASTTLANGKVLVVGGISSATNGITSVDLYDPSTRSFTALPPLEIPRYGHTATLLQDGRVLVVGNSPIAEVSKTTNCGPVLTVLVPNAGHIGDLVTIRGSGFGFSQGNSAVTFNGIATAAAPVWSPAAVQVNVPAQATTGPVTATVNGVTSNSLPFTVYVSADLNLTITSGPNPVHPGSPVTVTIKVQNLGTDLATSTTLKFKFSTLLKFVTFIQPAPNRRNPCRIVGNEMQCSLGNLRTGMTSTIQLGFSAQAVGRAAMTGAVQSTTPDPFPSNNRANTTEVIQ